MQVHLAAMNDEMWDVIQYGPIIIQKENPEHAHDPNAPRFLPKDRAEWNAEDRRRSNLDNQAKDVLYRSLDQPMFCKIKLCKSAKEIWDTVTALCEGSQGIKENKLDLAVQKFDNFKMKDGETLDQLDARFTGIINELTNLGRIYTNPELNRKILRSLPSIWNMKVTSMMDNKTYVPMSVQELFAELKAHEYELERMCNKASVSSAGPLALAVIDPRGKSKASDAMPECVE